MCLLAATSLSPFQGSLGMVACEPRAACVATPAHLPWAQKRTAFQAYQLGAIRCAESWYQRLHRLAEAVPPRNTTL
jgi:hypothetical protein